MVTFRLSFISDEFQQSSTNKHKHVLERKEQIEAPRVLSQNFMLYQFVIQVIKKEQILLTCVS